MKNKKTIKQKRYKRKGIQQSVCLCLLIVFLLPLAACANPVETAEPTTVAPTPTLSPTPEPTPTPSPTSIPTPTISPTPIPTPTPIPEPTRQMNAIYPSVAVFAQQNQTSSVLTYLSLMDEVGYLSGPDDNDLIEVLLPGDQIGYCQSHDLMEKGQTYYARTIEGEVASVLPPPENSEEDFEPEIKPVKLVDVRKYAPQIQVNQVFAQTDNFTGVVLYGRPICLLQESTLNKLRQAQKQFSEDGYTIKIYDAYRPYRVTLAFAEYLDNPRYLASPTIGSHHNRGAAVDMTLVDSNGIELEMPSLMHTLDSRAGRDNQDMTEAARRNLDYMSSVMQAAGFLIYQHEWWHFTDSNRYAYPIMDYCLGEIEVEASEPVTVPGKPPLVNPVDSGFVSISPTPMPTPTQIPTPIPEEEEAGQEISEESETNNSEATETNNADD